MPRDKKMKMLLASGFEIASLFANNKDRIVGIGVPGKAGLHLRGAV